MLKEISVLGTYLDATIKIFVQNNCINYKTNCKFKRKTKFSFIRQLLN